MATWSQSIFRLSWIKVDNNGLNGLSWIQMQPFLGFKIFEGFFHGQGGSSKVDLEVHDESGLLWA